ncbi:MAG: hypothetical protein HY720_01510 [Planctomycetes bacterium]|nr:hypothetical protein [Planctomycetota bacterium]
MERAFRRQDSGERRKAKKLEIHRKLVVAVALLAVADALATKSGIDHGLWEEANPVLSGALGLGMLGFFGAKALLTSVWAAVSWSATRRWLVVTNTAIGLAYTCVVSRSLWHLTDLTVFHPNW